MSRFDDDGYWMECVRRSKSNSAVNAWAEMVEYVESGKADDRTLRGMRCALRELATHCSDQLHQRLEARKRAA